jgi:hypothetical protein
MQKKWDKRQAPKVYTQWNTDWAKHALRVLKPGGHMIIFMSPVTMHRAMAGIEDAGFEIRDTCFYLHSVGFPKGYDIGQCIQKKLTIGSARRPDRDLGLTRDRWNGGKDGLAKTGGQVELTESEAIKWQGWNSQLKPAFEPCILFRKPLSEKSLADNVLKWGTGGINVGACRVLGAKNKRTSDGSNYPAHILHDGAVLPEQYSRFFYAAKASKKEKTGSKHLTQKPLTLMEYFVKMVTPPGGIVLDPFMGSNTTGIAAHRLGFSFIGVEQDPTEYQGAILKTRYHMGKQNVK